VTDQQATAAASLSQRALQALAHGFALSLAGLVAYFLSRMPFQVSDNLADILIVDRSSLGDIWESETGEGAVYFRPLLWMTIDVLYSAAHGHVFLTYKAFHALQIVVLFALFVRVARVRTAVDLSAAALALVALIGMHTFADNVVEAYPVNTYLTIVVATLAALNLSYGSPALWRGVATVLLLTYSLFTLETGALVLVVVVVAYLVGFRGVSTYAIVACAGIVGLYATLKFGVYSNRTPGLDERSSGFGFRGYDQSELVEKFGDKRPLFYLYNVASAFVTVFFAEPRAGIWRLTRSVVQGPAPTLALLIAVFTSTASTALIAFTAVRRRCAWRRRQFDHYDRLLVIALSVAVVNAIFSFPYLKDVIVGPAGVMYALAFYVAVRHVLLWLGRQTSRGRVWIAATALLALLSLGWSLRAVSVPYEMRRYAYQYRQGWADVDRWLVEQKLEVDVRQRHLIARLRREALAMEVPPPPSGLERFVDRR
jgi:hypothetical protein